MHAADSARTRLLPIAALVSLLVLLLGATGLFALNYTNTRSVAALERLRWLHGAQVAAVQTRISFKTQVQEWKNILLRGADPGDYATYLARFEQQEVHVQSGLAALQEELARLHLDSLSATSLLTAHRTLGTAYRNALATYDPARPETAFIVDTAVRGIDRQLNDDIDALAHAVQHAAENDLATFRAASDARYAGLRKATLALGTPTVLLAFWLVFQTVRSAPAVVRRA